MDWQGINRAFLQTQLHYQCLIIHLCVLLLSSSVQNENQTLLSGHVLAGSVDSFA
jgi:hypothetical protein